MQRTEVRVPIDAGFAGLGGRSGARPEVSERLPSWRPGAVGRRRIAPQRRALQGKTAHSPVYSPGVSEFGRWAGGASSERPDAASGTAPPIGFTLAQSAIRTKYGVTVVGVKAPGEDFTHAVPETKVTAKHTLIVSGPSDLLELLVARP